LKINAMMNMAKVVSALIFPLITFPYTSRILGPVGTGNVGFATSLVSYFVLLGSIGIPLYGIREVARIREDRKALAVLVQELLVLHAGATLFSFLAFLCLIAFNGKVKAESILFLVASASIPLSLLSMEWLYQGLEEYVYMTVRSICFSAVSVVALFLFVHHRSDYVVVAGISVVASLGSSVLNFWNARRHVFVRPQQRWDFRRHLKPLAAVYALNFITSIYLNLDSVMLGFLSSAESVGYYSSALKLTKMLLAVVVSSGSVLLPRLSWFLASGKRDEFDRMLRKSLGIVLLLCLPITIALMLLSREILLVFAGEQYLPAARCLIVTAPIILFIGLTNVFGIQILYPMGKDKDVVLSVGAGAVVALVLNALLIPRIAHMGAAWGILVAECVVLAVQFAQVRRAYEIAWPWASAWKCALATLGMGLLLLSVRSVVPETSAWLRLLLDVPLGASIYFFVLVVLKEEFVREILASLKGRFARG